MRRTSLLLKLDSIALIFLILLVTGLTGASAQTPSATPKRRNVLIFVADGLRNGSVNAKDTPTLWRIRQEGVYFQNSHSLFPTFTTANASAIATGHGLGDTGDFSNTIWLRYASFDTGNFNQVVGTPVPFIENDQILADLSDHYNGNYLGETTLLQAAREQGYNTASLGKLGPVAIQDAAAIRPTNGNFPVPSSIIIDDGAGTSAGIPLPPKLIQKMQEANLSPEAPTRSNGFGPTSQYNNGYSGDATRAGTIRPNLVQQKWLSDVATQALLPMFAEDTKPFLILYWSRDPDGTQHNQGDSLGSIFPGINGESSRAALQNADRSLAEILAWIDAHPMIKNNTDVFITSDHGFATVSRHELDRVGHTSSSESAKHFYLDANGRLETDKGSLPSGFLAIDLALGLRTNLFDPDRHSNEGPRRPYRQVRLDFDAWEHPTFGNGLLGGTVEKLDGSDAMAIVAANGGSDLVYVPDESKETVSKIVSLLLGLDYVGCIFVEDKYGAIPGTLPLSAIGLVGASSLPRPTVVVGFKFFYLNANDLQSAVQVSDTGLQQGQGMHGGFGRDSTYNNMAAIGPDFKKGFTDAAPVGNADIVPTLAYLLKLDLKQNGKLQGRVIKEAISGETAPPSVAGKSTLSPPANGLQTILHYEEFDGRRYLNTACLVKSDQPDKTCR